MMTATTGSIAYTLRAISELDQLQPIIELQRSVLGLEMTEVMPPRLVKTHAGAGGATHGLFDMSGRMFGFAFFFPGQLDGELVAWAYRLVIDPAQESDEVALGLRFAQFHAAKTAGFSRLCWTIDPFSGENLVRDVALPGILCRRMSPQTPVAGNRNGAPSNPLHLLLEWPCRGTDAAGPLFETNTAPIESRVFLKMDMPSRQAAFDETALQSPRVRIVLPRGDSLAPREKSVWSEVAGRAFNAVFTRSFSLIGVAREDGLPATTTFLFAASEMGAA